VILFNHDDKDYIVEEGSRIAQLILEKIEENVMIEETEGELEKT
jgi:dUTPase